MDKQYNRIIEKIKRSGLKIEIVDHDFLNPDIAKIVNIRDKNGKIKKTLTLYLF